ncbi:hypothetical protein [Ileibacterium valens]|uniref:Uncharacterized protein n=1 Tax=Ileibacterium valens TaxID=1862668 RepID=A0A1U7NCL0_9FIRM|nr:hypothetical protein [Ileibacterium valens]OLU36208.1 hypothetical protein BO222_12870 [Ileibacterium valens]OLU39814.1 hypothetical protein BM735_06750 [Erysipelotrichaceae bacterium NYU-BL-F16]OLU41456.1 hypothetical protein BO224_03490 [Erysipelotrichaceae bacterium NYU-BL-E8]
MSEYIFPACSKADEVQPMDHSVQQRTQSVVTQEELKGATDEINQRTNLRLSLLAGRIDGTDSSCETGVSAQSDLLSLESLRRSIALVIEKLPKGKNGVPEEEPFTELLAIENEVAINPIDSEELFKAMDTITPRQAMALVPILKGGGQ